MKNSGLLLKQKDRNSARTAVRRSKEVQVSRRKKKQKKSKKKKRKTDS